MRGIIVILVMLVCLFGPATIFFLVGYPAIEALGKRPSRGGRVMILLVTKLVIAGAVGVGILMVLLRSFG